VDPIFIHELAEELKMTVAELCHGRGTPMSAAELTRDWPLYYAWKRREAARQQQNESQRTLA
jgi:hypothetical protein